MEMKSYEMALYHIALNMVGMAPDNVHLYLRHGAVDISSIFGVARPRAYEELQAKYDELNHMYVNTFTISVREED